MATKGTPINWTDSMLNLIRTKYHILGSEKLAKRFGCSRQSVYNKKRELDAAKDKPRELLAVAQSTTLVTAVPPAGSAAVTSVVEADVPLQLVAMRPEQMQEAQRSLAAWFRQKIQLVEHEAHDALRNLEIAKQSCLRADSFDRASRIADRRVEYYKKLLAAVDAGYAIVPNFPVDVLAIRVTRDDPKWRGVTTFDKTYAIHQEKAELAPAGQGRYVNPQPTQRTREAPKKTLTNGREVQQFTHVIDGFREDVEFPVAIAQPAVLEATLRAMALNIFDEIGCLPARRKPDPIVVGRIYRPNDKYRNSSVTFLIAWWIDTRTL